MALSLTYPSDSTKEWSRPRIVGNRKVCEIQVAYTNAADVYITGGMTLTGLESLTGIGFVYSMTTQLLRIGANNDHSAGLAIEGGPAYTAAASAANALIDMDEGKNYAARGVSVRWNPGTQKMGIIAGGWDANDAGQGAGEVAAGTILGHPLGQIFFAILQIEGR